MTPKQKLLKKIDGIGTRVATDIDADYLKEIDTSTPNFRHYEQRIAEDMARADKRAADDKAAMDVELTEEIRKLEIKKLEIASKDSKSMPPKIKRELLKKADAEILEKKRECNEKKAWRGFENARAKALGRRRYRPDKDYSKEK